ncbi:hypothetical protein FB451DRAFT_1164201 [Mycena latifolia]|nr:hypothetical protein FB451DRAFT_1164201 [Mycena latifolia]
MAGSVVHIRTLRSCLCIVADSVTEVSLRVPRPGELSKLLQLDVLRRLTSLHIYGNRLLDVDYTSLGILRAYQTPSPERAVLESVTLNLTWYSNLQYGPRTSTIAELRALAADGMDIKVTMFDRSESETVVVFDSSACHADLFPKQNTVQSTGPEEICRLGIRTRLSEVNGTIDELTAEHKELQAESDSIIYSVLSLPADITIHIFQHCSPPDFAPRPFPSTAPLLLTQICRQWRHIALNTPELWQSLVFGDESSVEILKLWFLRAGNLPVNYSFQCRDASRGAALIETSVLHAPHWQDMTFRLPLRSLPKLDLRQKSLPMLRRISFDINQHHRVRMDIQTDVVILKNAPLLREVHISTLPYQKFDIPWHQLNTLTLFQCMPWAECMSLLRECPGLVNLVVSTSGSAPHNASPLTLTNLKSFTAHTGLALLEHLSLPCLQRLTISGVMAGEHTVFDTFIKRSACVLKYLSLSLNDVASNTLRSCLRAADSVTEVALRVPGQGRLFEVLQFDILPRLTSLRLWGDKVSTEDYTNLVAMLRACRAPSPERVMLNFVTLELAPYSELHDRRYWPSTPTLAELKVLEADGMNIKFTMTGKSDPGNHVVFDSSVL